MELVGSSIFCPKLIALLIFLFIFMFLISFFVSSIVVSKAISGTQLMKSIFNSESIKRKVDRLNKTVVHMIQKHIIEKDNLHFMVLETENGLDSFKPSLRKIYTKFNSYIEIAVENHSNLNVIIEQNRQLIKDRLEFNNNNIASIFPANLIDRLSIYKKRNLTMHKHPDRKNTNVYKLTLGFVWHKTENNSASGWEIEIFSNQSLFTDNDNELKSQTPDMHPQIYMANKIINFSSLASTPNPEYMENEVELYIHQHNNKNNNNIKLNDIKVCILLKKKNEA
uniref:Uncharacterized protein n=1 Tax=Metapenaeus joyneri majanivirus TaxID=2984280 RepID=A0A9C7C6L1_9VIRU|nr:MAG: hypothetical protein [Metapenaeus joyneri majanivirus]